MYPVKPQSEANGRIHGQASRRVERLAGGAFRLCSIVAVAVMLTACNSMAQPEGSTANKVFPSAKGFDVSYLLNVSNDALYDEYRIAIEPIFRRHGVTIRYDFNVAKTNVSETSQPTNRVFLATFRSQESMKDFFADPEYQIAKNKLEKSVTSFHVITHQ